MQSGYRKVAAVLSMSFVMTLGACSADNAVGPDATKGAATASSPELAIRGRSDIGGCDSIAVPRGSHLLAQYYARGSQIYFWDGQSWLFIGPDATLYADRREREVVGVHQIAGVWESKSGSKVVGQVQASCTPDASALPWQRLMALGHDGRGIFTRVDLIQRVRTQGGLAPTTPGTTYGEQKRVFYRAEYLFYRTGR